MQTFLPFEDFEASARALDVKRLGKQRVEVIQIVRALSRPDYAWSSHPAVLMWKGHEEALGRYGLTMCDIWVERGFDDTCSATIAADLERFGITHIRSQDELREAGELPSWVLDQELIDSHRSALVRKDPELYRPMFPLVPDDIAYVWPIRSERLLEAERRRGENAVKRAQRAVERAKADAEKAKRRRSRAARKGWRTRRTALPATDAVKASAPRAAESGST